MREKTHWALIATLVAVSACSDSSSVVGTPDTGTPVDDVHDASSDTSTIDAPVLDAPAMDVAPDVKSAPDASVDVTPDVAADVTADRGPECPTGRSACGGACVSTATDPAHCGACGTACPAGQVCAAGMCACPTGSTRCGDRCVDTTNDAANCGACNMQCPAGQVCAMSTCQLRCPGTQAACGGDCVTLATDSLHCGMCDRRCPVGARCETGMCRCPEGQTDCGGRCVDTSVSAAHCGMCDRACALANATAACVTGACRVAGCADGRGDCDGMAANGCEVATASDAMNCGACGRACTLARATAACAMGACAVASCEVNYADCDRMPANGCEVDTQTDARNCGACGTVCVTGRCVAGSCAPARNCLEIRTLQPASESGRYTIDPDGAGAASPFEAWCDMTTAGGGWTYLATVTNSGDAANAGRWLVTSPTPNAWESTGLTFGTLDPARNEDYRSAAFHTVEGRALMITHRNQLLLFTDDGCLQGRTLQAALARLNWTCGGSEDFTRHPACTNSCVIAGATPRTGDTALLAGAARVRLYLKAGEADGAQDTNRDRAYLSTNYRDNVDYPTGLGAFCSGSSCSPRTGEADVNDRSDAITPTAGTEFYGIWVR